MLHDGITALHGNVSGALDVSRRGIPCRHACLLACLEPAECLMLWPQCAEDCPAQDVPSAP